MRRWAFRLQCVIVAGAVAVAFAMGAAAQTPVASLSERPAIAAPPPPATPEKGADLATFVDGYVNSAMRADHVAGVGVAVVRDGRIVMSKGYGLADTKGRTVSPDHTLFRLASISKTFTWIGLMQLAEAGKVDLNQPANRYLPPSLQIPADGFVQPVLVRHLMTHSAGFEDRFAGHLFIDDPTQAVPLVDALARFRPHRVRPPGAAIVYSNYGAALAGAIIQNVSGLAFEDYVEQHILTPLALQNTTFREPYAPSLVQGRGLPSPMTPALAADVSDGFRWSNGAFIRQPFEHVVQFAPAGGASATTADMARYLTALMAGGGGVLSPKSVALFAREKPLFANAPGMGGIAYGMLQDWSPQGWRAWGHDGDTLHFHSRLMIYPDLKLGVFVTTNTDSGGELRSTLSHAIADFIGGPSRTHTRVPAHAAPKGLDRFAGAYLSDRRSFSSAERVLCLVTCLVRVSATDGKLVIGAGGESARYAPVRTFKDSRGRILHQFRDLETGKIATFLEEDGRITHFYPPSGLSRATRVSAFASAEGFFAVVALGLAAAACAFVSGLARVFGAPQRSARARLVGLALPMAGLAWLVSLGAFATYLARAADNPWVLFSAWPGGMRDGAFAGLGAALLTVIAAAATALGWRAAEWSVWRRARILSTLALLAALGAMLWSWSLLSLQF